MWPGNELRDTLTFSQLRQDRKAQIRVYRKNIYNMDLFFVQPAVMSADRMCVGGLVKLVLNPNRVCVVYFS